MGNEIKRDVCPEKYCAVGSVVKDSIPVLISIVLVAVFSGNLFNGAGLAMLPVVLVEAVVVLLMYGLYCLMLRGAKKRLAETYISVCENGVHGVYPLNGYKNAPFELSYSSVTGVTAKGERLILTSGRKKIVLTLKDAKGTAALIQEKTEAV